jgi:cytochrome c551/c552
MRRTNRFTSVESGITQPTIRLLFAACAAFATLTASAQDGAALAEQYKCGGCHAHGIGGTFESISGKYAGKPDATATIVGVIKNGTRGGKIQMPPSKASDADATAIANYILALKK